MKYKLAEIDCRQWKDSIYIEVRVCENCGTLVYDTDIHDKWHEGYGKVAQQAYSADMMHRPIGVSK